MKRLIINPYTFDASARQVTFTGIANFDIKRLYAIMNITRNQIIYAIGDPALGLSGITGNTIILVFDTTTHADTDTLGIMYDDFIDEIPGDDIDGVATAVRLLPQHVSRISYAKTLSGTVDNDFYVAPVIGTGMTVNQINGDLVITSGTTARSETVLRSINSWKGGIRMRNRVTLSQRIINQDFIIELTDIIGDGLAYTITSATAITVTIPNNPFTAVNVGQFLTLQQFSGTGTFLSGRYAIASVSGDNVVFTVSGFAAGSGTLSVTGWNYYRLTYSGTTATNALFQTQRNGRALTAVTATINSTASPGHLGIITANDLIATFADQLTASSGGSVVTPRAAFFENIPDDKNLRLQIRVVNGSTAPASTTTWTIGFTSISNFAGQDVTIQDVRPMAPNGMPIDIVRSIGLTIGTLPATPAGTNAIGDVGQQYRANNTGAGTATNLNSPATPATQTIKSGSGRLIGYYINNSNAATRFLKVFNTTTITLGTTPAVMDIPIPPNNNPVYVSFEGGIGFSTAIVVAITGARGLSDNTAITLNDVTGYTVHA